MEYHYPSMSSSSAAASAMAAAAPSLSKAASAGGVRGTVAWAKAMAKRTVSSRWPAAAARLVPWRHAADLALQLAITLVEMYIIVLALPVWLVAPRFVFSVWPPCCVSVLWCLSRLLGSADPVEDDDEAGPVEGGDGQVTGPDGGDERRLLVGGMDMSSRTTTDSALTRLDRLEVCTFGASADRSVMPLGGGGGRNANTTKRAQKQKNSDNGSNGPRSSEHAKLDSKGSSYSCEDLSPLLGELLLPPASPVVSLESYLAAMFPKQAATLANRGRAEGTDSEAISRRGKKSRNSSGGVLGLGIRVEGGELTLLGDLPSSWPAPPPALATSTAANDSRRPGWAGLGAAAAGGSDDGLFGLAMREDGKAHCGRDLGRLCHYVGSGAGMHDIREEEVMPKMAVA